MSPEAVIELLNRIFSGFDALLEDRPVEKIKTIGDAWMAVSGAPDACTDHAGAVADLALALRDRLRAIARDEGLELEVRVGIHSGEAMAGVIGTRKPAYDLWGDTVNTASRMEASGVPGRIQVSAATRALLDGRYRMEARGVVEIAGKGPMETWFLEGPVEAPT
jgi:class 3 adenylate cyclase